MNVNGSFAEALERLQGEQLSSVEFVQDYVQLRFDGPCLSAYNPHHITSSNSTIAWREPGYCDALCKLIAHRVQKATVAEDSIRVSFDNDAVWTMSLGDQGRTGPEAFYFVDHEGNFWVD
ncbi:MAG TPA: hypothetical protein VF532_05650 [Candidatus Angelobacter sp.]